MALIACYGLLQGFEQIQQYIFRFDPFLYGDRNRITSKSSHLDDTFHMQWIPHDIAAVLSPCTHTAHWIEHTFLPTSFVATVSTYVGYAVLLLIYVNVNTLPFRCQSTTTREIWSRGYYTIAQISLYIFPPTCVTNICSNLVMQVSS